MATLESRKVNGKRIELKRFSSSKPGKQYEYHVTEDGSRIIEPFTNKRDAKSYYEDTVSDFQRRQGKERSESRGSSLFGGGGGGGFGLGGGGNGGIPGVGMDSDDDDEDDGFRFPGF